MPVLNRSEPCLSRCSALSLKFLRVRGKQVHRRRLLVSRLDSAVPERALCQNSNNVIHVADDGALCQRLAWLKADWSSCACFSSSGLSTPTTFARSWSSRPFSVAMKFISVHCFFFKNKRQYGVFSTSDFFHHIHNDTTSRHLRSINRASLISW